MIDYNTWIISDTHFFHKNIVKYCGRPEDHNERMIAAWKAYIKPEDTVMHLGDVYVGTAGAALKLLPTLPGKKYLIRGNHDKKSIKWFSEQAGFEVVGTHLYLDWKGNRVLLSHYPETKALDWDINIHGHIHTNGYAPGTPMKDYRNVSVEVMDYQPWKLSDILYGHKFQSRTEAGNMAMTETIVRLSSKRMDANLTEIERNVEPSE